MLFPFFSGVCSTQCRRCHISAVCNFSRLSIVSNSAIYRPSLGVGIHSDCAIIRRSQGTGEEDGGVGKHLHQLGLPYAGKQRRLVYFPHRHVDHIMDAEGDKPLELEEGTPVAFVPMKSAVNLENLKDYRSTANNFLPSTERAAGEMLMVNAVNRINDGSSVSPVVCSQRAIRRRNIINRYHKAVSYLAQYLKSIDVEPHREDTSNKSVKDKKYSVSGSQARLDFTPWLEDALLSSFVALETQQRLETDEGSKPRSAIGNWWEAMMDSRFNDMFSDINESNEIGTDANALRGYEVLYLGEENDELLFASLEDWIEAKRASKATYAAVLDIFNTIGRYHSSLLRREVMSESYPLQPSLSTSDTSNSTTFSADCHCGEGGAVPPRCIHRAALHYVCGATVMAYHTKTSTESCNKRGNAELSEEDRESGTHTTSIPSLIPLIDMLVNVPVISQGGISAVGHTDSSSRGPNVTISLISAPALKKLLKLGKEGASSVGWCDVPSAGVYLDESSCGEILEAPATRKARMERFFFYRTVCVPRTVTHVVRSIYGDANFVDIDDPATSDNLPRHSNDTSRGKKTDCAYRIKNPTATKYKMVELYIHYGRFDVSNKLKSGEGSTEFIPSYHNILRILTTTPANTLGRGKVLSWFANPFLYWLYLGNGRKSPVVNGACISIGSKMVWPICRGPSIQLAKRKNRETVVKKRRRSSSTIATAFNQTRLFPAVGGKQRLFASNTRVHRGSHRTESYMLVTTTRKIKEGETLWLTGLEVFPANEAPNHKNNSNVPTSKSSAEGSSGIVPIMLRAGLAW